MLLKAQKSMRVMLQSVNDKKKNLRLLKLQRLIVHVSVFKF